MCRISVFGGIDEFGGLSRTLARLEQSLGGHGNGYWDTVGKNVVKGLAVTPELIAAMAVNEPGIHVFHTRLATAGGIKGRLNHPFEAGDDTVLVHNGHWSEWEAYADDKEESDTECAASMVAKHGPGVLLSNLFWQTGVWVVSSPKETLIIPRVSGRFHAQFLYGGGWFHASETTFHTLDVKKTQTVEAHKSWSVDEKTGALELADTALVNVEDRMERLGSERNWSYWAGTTSQKWAGVRAACIICGAREEMEHWETEEEFMCANCWKLMYYRNQTEQDDKDRRELTETGEDAGSASVGDILNDDALTAAEQDSLDRWEKDLLRPDSDAGIERYKGSAVDLRSEAGEVDEEALLSRGIDPEAYGIPARNNGGGTE